MAPAMVEMAAGGRTGSSELGLEKDRSLLNMSNDASYVAAFRSQHCRLGLLRWYGLHLKVHTSSALEGIVLSTSARAQLVSRMS